jgi:hypothetical protein
MRPCCTLGATLRKLAGLLHFEVEAQVEVKGVSSLRDPTYNLASFMGI